MDLSFFIGFVFLSFLKILPFHRISMDFLQISVLRNARPMGGLEVDGGAEAAAIMGDL
jgi:hypothetical protein